MTAKERRQEAIDDYNARHPVRGLTYKKLDDIPTWCVKAGKKIVHICDSGQEATEWIALIDNCYQGIA